MLKSNFKLAIDNSSLGIHSKVFLDKQKARYATLAAAVEKPIEKPLPWYRKHGFKRTVGFLMSGAVTVMFFFHETVWIATGLSALGVPTLVSGIVDGRNKKKKAVDQSDNVWRPLLLAIVKLINYYLSKRR